MSRRVTYMVVRACVLPLVVMYALMWANHHQTAYTGQKPVVEKAIPEWNHHYAKRFTNCRDAQKVKRFAGELVVVNINGKAYREQFDTAWANNHDYNQTNDLWVIGKCL